MFMVHVRVFRTVSQSVFCFLVSIPIVEEKGGLSLSLSFSLFLFFFLLVC